MTNRVYPLGYSRHSALIEQLMANPRTLLIDTRFSPNSKMPQWTSGALKAKYGKRYRLAGKFLGNIHFNATGPMTLANPTRGIQGLVQYLQEGYDCILLCGCAEYTACHLSMIVELLRGTMPSVEVIMPEQIACPGMLKCISTQQPFCWVIMNGKLLEQHGIPPKIVENRTWTTQYRGPILLRAGSYDGDFFEKKKLSTYTKYLFGRMIGDEDAKKLYEIMPKDKSEYPSGGIVGQCTLADVLDWHDDAHWKVWEQYGLVLANIEPLPFAPVRGAFRLFDVPESILVEAVH